MQKNHGIADDILISQCKKGSLKHQELLYKQFYGYAMGISLRYSFSRDDALEVVNDAFIKVFNAIGNYDSSKAFKGWLRTIVVNTAIDRRRKDMKHQFTTEIDDSLPLPSSQTTVDRLNVNDILKIMDALPAVQRAIFNLYEIDGYNHEEIAVMLDIPASSSRVYLSRAKEKLRNLINTEAQQHER
ncbi:RNA polymerase sigma factor [Mucilaginibacter sp. KACC 22063]|uniref:RNA polymerase sigma factor n=1 Tax=Mucilaginibacter sp. KACC 22063 TaxID=3025666 RepID=UPI0023650E3C|nr:RNA polymerase sigma factor [Mucilaginibacter sp. KACC 22063]WDF56868.1 RNA polymerase sigma factor [Mucilaginibacter sp. KACC 22063]